MPKKNRIIAAAGAGQDELSTIVPRGCQASPDVLTAIAYSVPHTVVPQLLWSMLADTMAATAFLLRSLHDARICVKKFAVGSWDATVPVVLDFVRELSTNSDSTSSQQVVLDKPCAEVSWKSKAVLAEVQLTNHDDIDVIVASFSALHPQLRSLDLGQCGSITAAGCIAIGTLTSLQTLCLFGCRNVDGAALAPLQQHPCITALDVGCCHLIDGVALAVFARMPRLRSLNTFRCYKVDASVLAEFAKVPSGAVPSIEELHMRHCDGVNAAAMAAIASRSPLPNLRLLDVACCPNIDADALVEIATITTLEDLVLGACQNVDATGLAAVSGKLCRLRSLQLWYCDGVNAEALSYVARLPSLETLDVDGCSLDEAAVELLCSLPARCRCLTVRRCSGAIGRATVERLKRCIPCVLSGLDDDQ